jgi:hypothetical protein
LRQSEAKLDQVIASLSRDFPVDSPDHDEFKFLLSLIAAERETLSKTVAAGYLVVPVPAKKAVLTRPIWRSTGCRCSPEIFSSTRHPVTEHGSKRTGLCRSRRPCRNPPEPYRQATIKPCRKA